MITDNFYKTGNDVESFLAASKEMEACTSVEKIDLGMVLALHLIGETDTDLEFRVFDADSWAVSKNNVLFVKKKTNISKQDILEEKGGEEILHEIRANKLAFMVHSENNPEIIFVGKSLYQTLAARLPVSGYFLKTPSIERSAVLGKVLADSGLSCTGVIRQSGRIKKLLAIFMGKEGIPSATGFLEEMPIQNVEWEMRQRQSSITFSLEDISAYAQRERFPYNPAFTICVSMTGYNSPCIKEIFSIGDAQFQVGIQKAGKYGENFHAAMDLAKEHVLSIMQQYKPYIFTPRGLNSYLHEYRKAAESVSLAERTNKNIKKDMVSFAQKYYGKDVPYEMFPVIMDFMGAGKTFGYSPDTANKLQAAIGDIFLKYCIAA